MEKPTKKEKKANKVFVRIEFPTVRVLKENMRIWHLHSPKGMIKRFEDEDGVECNEDGTYKPVPWHELSYFKSI